MDIRTFFNSKKTKSEILQTIEEKGYIVIDNVLNLEEVEIATKMFHDWRKSVPNLDYQHKEIDPHGIYKFHQVGHQRHAWYIRTRPKVKDIFKELWGTDNLIVSYDGSCYMEKDCKVTNKVWTHTDQKSPRENEPDIVKCVQGFVSLTGNTHKTFLCYEGSNKLHKDYHILNNIVTTKNWEKIDLDYLEQIKNKKRILSVKKGSLVLWDSRTFHQNTYGDEKNNEERLVQYVCMLPRNHKDNTESNRKKRLKYFEDKRTTSHWPCPVRVNGLQPHTWGDELKEVNYENLPKIDLDDMMDDIKKLI